MKVWVKFSSTFAFVLAVASAWSYVPKDTIGQVRSWMRVLDVAAPELLTG